LSLLMHMLISRVAPHNSAHKRVLSQDIARAPPHIS